MTTDAATTAWIEAIRRGDTYEYENDQAAFLAGWAAAETHLRAEVAAQAWDECCEGFAWALVNGPDDMAIEYVRDHNPYRARAADLREKP